MMLRSVIWLCVITSASLGSAVVAKARRQHAFFLVVSAQFLSSLADNALLVAAIGLLAERHSAPWMIPALRLCFYFSYVVLAVFAGAIADAFPKARIILLTNLVKLAGCGLLLTNVHPLLAYGLIGLGAAAYSPARYGILPELLPADRLIAANAWFEVTTVLSILLGFGLGSFLMNPAIHMATVAGTRAKTAVFTLSLIYVLASMSAAAIPADPASNPSALANPQKLFRDFHDAIRILWRDPESQISLAVTSLFWAASATLQFVILRWGAQALQLNLSNTAMLQTSVAVGMVAGAIAAARWIPLRRALAVIPLGFGIAAAIIAMVAIKRISIAAMLLTVIGVLSGLLLVPMNAMLQERGHLLMHSGQAIAVQNFSECLASLVLLAVYGVLLQINTPLAPTIIALGILLSIALLSVIKRRGTLL